MARRYNQDCVLAHALDILGERWTLLILRDLLLGPRRFGDLQAGMPGIGANLLSKRLKELEEAGLIESIGDGRSGYRLSEMGEDLRPTIRQLLRWAIHYFKTCPTPSAAQAVIYSDDLQPDSVALVIEIFADSCEPTDMSYVAQVVIDDFPYTLYYMNQEMIVRRGGDAPAAARLATDVATMMKAYRGELSVEEAKNKMTLTGDAKVISHLLALIVHQQADEWMPPKRAGLA